MLFFKAGFFSRSLPLTACVGMVLVRVAICIVFVFASQQTQSAKKKKKKKKEKEKNPAHYVISIQISGERTAAAYVITVFTLLIYYKPRPRNYRVLHRALYNPRPQAEGCMRGVKPDNFEAEVCNIFKAGPPPPPPRVSHIMLKKFGFNAFCMSWKNHV